MTTKTHYVYKIANLNPIDEQQFYIGVHSDDNPNSLNDGYMGSSKYLDAAMKEQGSRHFKKEILSVWHTREEADMEEARIHHLFDAAKHNNYYNRHNATTNGFSNVGMTTVLNTETNKIETISIEEYKNNDLYITPTTGMTTAFNIETNKIEHITVEEYKSNSKYLTPTSNKVSVKDTRDGKTKSVSKDDFDKFNYYVSVNAKTIIVYDDNDDQQFISHKSFVKFCKEYNLPHSAFQKSHQQNGFPLYASNDLSNLHTITKNGNIKYKGWYALEMNNNQPNYPLIEVRDLRDDSIVQVSRKDFRNAEYYIHPDTICMKIFNDTQELQHYVVTNFGEYCKKYKLPLSALRESIKNNGEPIYPELGNGLEAKLKRTGNIKYKGWYAVKG